MTSDSLPREDSTRSHHSQNVPGARSTSKVKQAYYDVNCCHVSKSNQVTLLLSWAAWSFSRGRLAAAFARAPLDSRKVCFDDEVQLRKAPRNLASGFHAHGLICFQIQGNRETLNRELFKETGEPRTENFWAKNSGISWMVMIAMRKNAIRLVVRMCRVQTNKWPCRILQHHRQAHGSFPESRREYSQFCYR